MGGLLALAETKSGDKGAHHEDTRSNDANQDAQCRSELEIGEASAAYSAIHLHLGRQQSDDGLLSGLDEDRFADSVGVDGRHLKQSTDGRDDSDASEKDSGDAAVAVASCRLVGDLVDDDTVGIVGR